MEIFMITLITVVLEDIPQLIIQYAYAKSSGFDDFTIFSLANTGLSVVYALMTKAGIYIEEIEDYRGRTWTSSGMNKEDPQARHAGTRAMSNPLSHDPPTSVLPWRSQAPKAAVI
jgi:hypothetical protein